MKQEVGMRGHHISRKFYPVRIQRKYLRTVRGKNRYISAREVSVGDSVSITLKDLGDIDVKELNTIPSSIAEEEVLSWKEGSDMKTDERTPCPNPLLQVNSGKFCPMCTAELVKIHGNDSGSDTCIHMEQTEDEVLAKARSFFEQNVMTLLNGFDENIPEKKSLQVITSKDRDETIRSKKQENRKLLARGLPPENKITCSMSKLSMQAYLCTSESTISAVISEAVQTPPSLFVWSSSSDEKLFGQSAEEGKLKLLCGELLLQLCKATAGNALKREAADQSIASITNSNAGIKLVPNTNSQDQKHVDHNTTTITQQFPEWVQGLTRERSRSQPGMQLKNEMPFQGSTTVRYKAPSKSFKPLLCTKLSVPWRGRKHSSHQYAMYVRTEPTANLPDDNSGMLAKSVSSLTDMDNSKLEVIESQPTKMYCQTAGRSRQEPAKRKNKEFREPEVCPKCKSSMRSIHHNSPITVKTKPTKGRRERAHKRWSSKRHTRLSKERRAKRHNMRSNGHGGAVPKNSDTKYFIKSFFTGTSSETTPKTKSNDKTSRNLLVKPYVTRRKKSTFTLPHNVTVGQAGLNFTKKKPEQEVHVRQLPGKIRSKDDVDLLMSRELKMINKHVKAHEKQINETSAPMFHTCFKHILSREFKNKGVHVRKPTIPQKDSSHQKKPRGIGNMSSFPQKLEKRKFNDSLFSCLIPRVFK